MRTLQRWTLLAFGLLAAALWVGAAIAIWVYAPAWVRKNSPLRTADTGQRDLVPDPSAPVVFRPLHPEFVCRPAGGRVIEITGTSITLHDRGTVRTYALSESLIAGRWDRPWVYDCPDPTHGGAYGYQYRASDVRVGDIIAISFSRVEGVDICDDIAIGRRPGGRVPPMPGDNPDAALPFHEKMNILQECEERGIPVPHPLPVRRKGPIREVAPAPRPVE
jgi:hypothetical protein